MMSKMVLAVVFAVGLSLAGWLRQPEARAEQPTALSARDLARAVNDLVGFRLVSDKLWSDLEELALSINFFGFRLVNVYSPEPNQRILELLNNSEDLREIEKEWERLWSDDKPLHLPREEAGDNAP
jgi:hypothetical protein